MIALDAWRTRIQTLVQSLDSIGQGVNAEQIRTRRSELVGRTTIFIKDLEQTGAIPQPREDRREAWAAVFYRLVDEAKGLAEQTSPGPTIRRAQLLSLTLKTALLDTLHRIYELDDIAKPDPTPAEPKLPRFDVTYGSKLGSGASGLSGRRQICFSSAALQLNFSRAPMSH